MNIIEATQRALKTGLGIRNKDCRSWYLLPTNTDECYIVIPDGFTSNGKKAAPHWNPKASDILADDWELTKVSEKRS